MLGNNQEFLQMTEIVNYGKWLMTESDVLVNMDRIESVEIQSLHHNAVEHKVVLYQNSQDDPYVACRGSETKCKEYLRTLRDFIGGKKIIIYETHPCSCQCGCKEQIIDGFEICDNCIGEHNLAKESMVFK